MSSSKPTYRNVPPPPGSRPSVYSRFIPREELESFSAWNPGSLGGDRAAETAQRTPEAPAKPPEQALAEQLHAARQLGYQDGYRDGLAALESFRQTFAQQVSAQMGALLRAYGQQMDDLQQDLARTLAVSATHLARAIVRDELTARPERVAKVAQEALDTLLLSAKHITLRVHPDDHALVAQGAAEVLAARGGRLLADPAITRGGCIVESDIGVIDAGIEARWRRASASLGIEEAWTPPEPDLEPDTQDLST